MDLYDELYNSGVRHVELYMLNSTEKYIEYFESNMMNPVSKEYILNFDDNEEIVDFYETIIDKPCYDINIGFLDCKNECYSNDLQFMKVIPTSKCFKVTFHNNYLRSISGIENKTELKIFEFSGNRAIKSLIPLKNLLKLEELYCSYNMIVSLRGVENLNKLRVLKINSNYLKSLAEISTLVNLEVLEFSNNYITSLLPITNLPKLKHIRCNNNLIKYVPAKLYHKIIDNKRYIPICYNILAKRIQLWWNKNK